MSHFSLFHGSWPAGRNRLGGTGPITPPVVGFSDHFVDVVGGELLHDQRIHGVLLGVLGGRPRGRFRAVIAPRVKISPPQTPCGSWRSSALARQEPRIGQGAQCALASSRSSGRSENHSCGLCRWQGSGAPVACACLVSRARELPGMTRHRLPGIGVGWTRRSGCARRARQRLVRRAT
jgi:hypothetical protein